ncbi:uncharacterized protein HMPREF1541_00852 [Cyphellophora europaea CBS 101466]|uniref:Uncharacterized protein n=1 Tax=Cyphellophora europaea (strain CBS 101466) TaxID=1220924 RepID=W2SD65_CYPE1|nr:uncharacterized protein HMPREF1541_00852 [Cyphellophora europaea CBS 101466]ETN46666.1 hypothetical protein HMPREF1541_00852 [Cyphellophora europaea CBS 101466]
MILSQFCGARTESYTGHVSGVICRQFRISLKGSRNVSSALNNLPIYRTPDENLTFGWATKNLIRARAVHESAYENLATMIALSESFHEPYAARVMFELAKIHAGPDDITPHLDQWKAVIHSMNGAFATSDFGILVEDYIRLNPYSLRVDLDEAVLRFPISAKLVAHALIALAKVTTGETRQLTLVGSAVISWLAAIADWIYDLRIAIYATDSSEPLHSTHSPDAGPTQMLFILRESPGIDLYPGTWAHSDQQQVQSLAASEATAKVRKLSLNAHSYPKSMHVTPFSGRVAWQSLLPLVFGRAYHVLDHSCASLVGEWIGGIARLFQALATGEETENPELLAPSQKANTATYGPGLIRTLTDWLPELRRMQGRMERQLKLSGDEAQKSIVAKFKQLREHCGCGICSSERPPAGPSDGKNGNLLLPEHGYCLMALAETIVALGLTLSGLTVSPQLYPSRAGIQSLYYSQVLRRLAARGCPWQQHFQLVYGDEWAAGDARRLSTAVMLFSGSRPRKSMVEKLVAVSHEGICCYFVDLEKVNTKGKTESAGTRLIKVVSGGINLKWKVFDRACMDDPMEGNVEGLLAGGTVWESVAVEHLEEKLYLQ